MNPLGIIMDSATWRDVVEVLLLTLAVYGALRVLGRTRSAGVMRGLALLVAIMFLLAQTIVAALDLTVIGKVLDYLFTIGILALVIIFQPELRRGLLVLGRYPLLRLFSPSRPHAIADTLEDAAGLLSRQGIGALVVIERDESLDALVETGTRLDAELSVPLLHSIFFKNNPLHDGAVIVRRSRLLAAGCQLPLGSPGEGLQHQHGMRHRAAQGVSEETDAVVLVVSEETGRISIVFEGKVEAVDRERVSRRLAECLAARPAAPPARRSLVMQAFPRKEPPSKEDD
jgi:diadenylate cyclase